MSASLQAAQAALERRDFNAARQAAEQVLRERPSDPGANQVLGIVALEHGDVEAAKKHLQRADAAAPGQPHILNTLGVVLRRSNDLPAARRAFVRAGERGLIDAWRNLGALEASAGDAKSAARAYERALKINEKDVASHAGLAQALELQHELARARSHAEIALAGDPQNEVAALALAQVAVRERKFDEAEVLAGNVARRGVSTTNRALAWGVIGDARDKQDDPAAAFAAFTESNRLLLKANAAHLSASHLPYHPDGVMRITAFVESETLTWPRSGAFETPPPVFLVGFPRSGTTLLEQVLSAHPSLVCIEEREHLALSAPEAAADPRALVALTDSDIEAIRAEYWRRVRAETDVGKRIVIDKLPLNVIFLPLIKRVFPDAKIILALRDPRDVVLSCYQQRFGMNAAMVQFLDLGSAAAYYDKVMKLGLMCRERLDLSIYEVRYEDVVADLETVARNVSAFLELPFDPAMLSFREVALKRNINTPSGRQVVEPIYNRSISRWKRYENELAPVLPLLHVWSARLGYT